ncbi:GNAT family N-acetyltransferase [Deinococcus misasensis]|uniref:GNAT family N-acetyltransferase n=1 Tax=Deinococcus misasensis TaxID=392413 RepID=UPI00068A1465|nr:GNAT family N-acetyltransferase [Deinococcus misasensis]
MHLRLLQPEDHRLFTELMVQAFCEDPLFVHLLGKPVPLQKARALESFLFEKAFLMQEQVWGLLDQQDLLAAAVLSTPESNTHLTLPLVIRTLNLLGPLGGRGLLHLNAYQQKVLQNSPAVPHHYLIQIGVHPEQQGKGLGKTLLDRLWEEVCQHPTSQGLALDTENAKNVSLYQHLSFKLTATTGLPPLHIHSLFRPRDAHA